ncbi:MAG: DUF6282 family protein [Bryobacteraceae bacterium]
MRRVWWVLPLVLAPLCGQALTGVVDLHVHSGPDSMPRSIDALNAARRARERGLRAILLKNHFEPTAALAQLARQAAPGLEVFGGITLNRTVGGINAAAVERMTRVEGGAGRVVWMPTFDAENQVRYSKEKRPFVAVSRDGKLLAEVHEVLAVMARSKLTLATGHSSPAEALMLIRAAREAGIDRVLVTHATKPPVLMTVAHMREAARLGALLEFDYNGLIDPAHKLDLTAYVEAIRAVGVENVVLSSDLGQANFPLHADGLEAYFRALRGRGFSEEEISRMAKVNPARLVGLVP